MNRLTRIIVATVVGYGLSRVMPPKQVQADAQSPTLHPIVVGVLNAPTFKWSKQHTPYLDSMRVRFDLDGVTANAKSDVERVRALTHWTRTRFDHDSCADYAVTLSGALNAVGLPARVVNLRTSDSETRVSGAGHTIAEAYLRDAKRWVMIDGQWDIMPLVKGKPASALELKKAIDGKSASISYISMSGIKPAEYGRWIAPYMFYMDAKLDQRIPSATDSHVLMLVPQGAKAPRVFQRKYPLKNMLYTTAPALFYPKIIAPAPPAAEVDALRKPVAPGRPLAATLPRTRAAARIG